METVVLPAGVPEALEERRAAGDEPDVAADGFFEEAQDAVLRVLLREG